MNSKSLKLFVDMKNVQIGLKVNVCSMLVFKKLLYMEPGIVQFGIVLKQTHLIHMILVLKEFVSNGEENMTMKSLQLSRNQNHNPLPPSLLMIHML